MQHRFPYRCHFLILHSKGSSPWCTVVKKQQQVGVSSDFFMERDNIINVSKESISMLNDTVDLRILSEDEEEKSWLQKIIYIYGRMHTHNTEG